MPAKPFGKTRDYRRMMMDCAFVEKPITAEPGGDGDGAAGKKA